MSRYRRNREGQVYFFTVVTDQRRPFLTSALGRVALSKAFKEVRISAPFDMIGMVLLPDHLHTIWELPHRGF